MISVRISTDATLQLMTEDSELLTLRMTDKVFERNGDKISGLVTFEVKKEKYRVTLQSLTRKMGIKTVRTARAFGVANEVSDYNGVRFEDDFLTRTLSGIKPGTSNLRGLDYYNKLFGQAFEYVSKVSSRKDEW